MKLAPWYFAARQAAKRHNAMATRWRCSRFTVHLNTQPNIEVAQYGGRVYRGYEPRVYPAPRLRRTGK